jgi:tRNA-dihydrouridine synthase A
LKERYLTTIDVPTREEVVKKIVEYCLAEVKKGTRRVNQVMRHTVGLFHGINGANYWKRIFKQ